MAARLYLLTGDSHERRLLVRLVNREMPDLPAIAER